MTFWLHRMFLAKKHVFEQFSTFQRASYIRVTRSRTSDPTFTTVFNCSSRYQLLIRKGETNSP